MNEQLMLTQKELEDLGFKSNWVSSDELNPAVAWWEFSILNGHIIYNPSTPPYIWYLKTEIGEVANWLHLNIGGMDELISLFHILNIKIEHLFN